MSLVLFGRVLLLLPGFAIALQQFDLRVQESALHRDRSKLHLQGPCDVLLDGEACLAQTGCVWREAIAGTSARDEGCMARIAWLHIMKCGSSFGTVLAHYANSSLPEGAHIPSGQNTSDPEDTILEGSQGDTNFFLLKYPVPIWFKDVFWFGADGAPGMHRIVAQSTYDVWRGNFFGMFRQPERRALSSYKHFGKPRSNGSIEEYAAKIQGQQVKMLSGYDDSASIMCELMGDESKCGGDPSSHVSLAISRLQGFAFVGLTEEYDLSVCLFHKMIGGECLPVEFMNMRPGIRDESDGELLDRLRAKPDPYDGALHKAASNIFWENVKKYDVRRSTCATICEKAANVFSLPKVTVVPVRGLTERTEKDSEYDWPGRLHLDD